MIRARLTKPHLPERDWRCSETRPAGTAGQVAPSIRVRRPSDAARLQPDLDGDRGGGDGQLATTDVRVTTRRRAVTNSGGAVSENAPRLLAVAVATCVEGAGEREVQLLERHRGRAGAAHGAGDRSAPMPQIGRTVEGVMATPVGTRAVVNVRLPRARDARGAGRDGAEVVPGVGPQAGDRGADRDGRSRPRRSPARASRCRRTSTCRTRSGRSWPAPRGLTPAFERRARARSRPSPRGWRSRAPRRARRCGSVRSTPALWPGRVGRPRRGSGRSCSWVRPGERGPSVDADRCPAPASTCSAS